VGEILEHSLGSPRHAHGPDEAHKSALAAVTRG